MSVYFSLTHTQFTPPHPLEALKRGRLQKFMIKLFSQIGLETLVGTWQRCLSISPAGTWQQCLSISPAGTWQQCFSISPAGTWQQCLSISPAGTSSSSPTSSRPHRLSTILLNFLKNNSDIVTVFKISWQRNLLARTVQLLQPPSFN